MVDGESRSRRGRAILSMEHRSGGASEGHYRPHNGRQYPVSRTWMRGIVLRRAALAAAIVVSHDHGTPS